MDIFVLDFENVDDSLSVKIASIKPWKWADVYKFK